MKKKELPSLPLFTDKFLAETLHINICETGIYIKLLCWYWTKKRGITKDEAFKIVNDDKYNKSIVYVLIEFFIFNEDNLRYEHKRLEQEHEYLKDYYLNKAKSGRMGGLNSNKQTVSKIQPPISISIPISIPNKLIVENFEIFWSLLTHKKGSKHLALKRYTLHCHTSDPSDIAERFNRYTSTVKDKEFLAHVATWINQKRFEDEETNKPIKIIEPIYEYDGIKLNKYAESGEYIELKDIKGNKYQKHKWNGSSIEKV
tara:strand:- start:1025 stop:1798 length:774 start_codon:yes stop_codon:yes gene_type:complete